MREDWAVLTSFFPEDWREIGRSSGALRRLRGFRSEDDLMRVLLLHVAQGYSLRETVVLAAAAGLAEVSDVALLKRFKSAASWFRELSLRLMADAHMTLEPAQGVAMQFVDATHVKEPGKTGSCWRIHYALDFPTLRCRHFAVTPNSGEGVGESFKHFPVQPDDCLIGDRGYSKADGVAHVAGRGGHVILRYNPLHMLLHHPDGKRFDIDDALSGWPEEKRQTTWTCAVQPAQTKPIAGRLIAVRKSREAANAEIKRLRRNASKKQYTIRRPILEYAKYVLIFTTLPEDRFNADFCLDWYRARWQIELIFKRLKSLAKLGHLPKRDPDSSQAWLYGKLFTGLLAEKLIRYGKEVSPWGYDLPGKKHSTQPMA